MRNAHALCLAFLIAAPSVSAQSASAPYEAAASRIIQAALADSVAWERMAYMGDTFGHRLSGSDALEASIDWILETMKADGLENVRGQPAYVPVWIRGHEEASILTDRGEFPLTLLGLGGTIATPQGGLTAEVLVVSSFDDLAARASEAVGKMVLYNVPFTSYGQTVAYRVGGAVAASKAGAVASLIRSVGPTSLNTPHTGTMRYDEGVAPIPAAALTIEGAERIQRMFDRGEKPVVRLFLSGRTAPDRLSRNVIGEYRGRESPNEWVVVGGHIDSWDVGQGMMDDASGCMVAWEAVRLLKRLGLRPRRTVQVAMWTNEENGGRGGQAYRDSVGTRIGDVQLAMEHDGGIFDPVGFGVSAAGNGLELLRAAAEPLIMPVLSQDTGMIAGITAGGGGADISPMTRDGVPGSSIRTENSTYFNIHHTPADTADKQDPAHMARAVAATAIMIYVAAEMPERLPHGAASGGEE